MFLVTIAANGKNIVQSEIKYQIIFPARESDSALIEL